MADVLPKDVWELILYYRDRSIQKDKLRETHRELYWKTELLIMKLHCCWDRPDHWTGKKMFITKCSWCSQWTMEPKERELRRKYNLPNTICIRCDYAMNQQADEYDKQETEAVLFQIEHGYN